MADEVKYLQPDDIRHIHDYVIKVSGGLEGEIHNGLDSLCQNAQSYHNDQTLEGLAAFYLSRLAKGHSFNDGNKRTAYFATRFFLMLNGADFNGRDIHKAVEEMVMIATAGNGEAYRIARELAGKYVVTDQVILTGIEQFERIVLKSIGVANILSKS